MELNKTFAAILLAGIIAMASGFIAELVISPNIPEVNAYLVEGGTGEPLPAVEEPTGPPPILGLLASADVGAGEALSRACVACHSFEQGAPNKVGPNNWNVVGNLMAHVDGFRYSDAMQARHDEGVVWDYEALNQFLYRPRDYMPGTTMSYAGLRNEEDRANMIAWLRTLSDSPAPLPTPDEIAAAEAAFHGEEAVEEAEAVPAESEAEQPAGEEGAQAEPEAEQGAQDGGATTP